MVLSLKNIKLSINNKIIEKFPHIDLQSRDIKEGFKRPSFFVQLDNLSKTDYLYSFERSLTVRIHYFPSDRYEYQLEILEKQEVIEELFKLGLAVEDRFISIVDGIESEIVDGVLLISFDLKYFDSNESHEEGKKMQELIVDGGQ